VLEERWITNQLGFRIADYHSVNLMNIFYMDDFFNHNSKLLLLRSCYVLIVSNVIIYVLLRRSTYCQLLEEMSEKWYIKISFAYIHPLLKRQETYVKESSPISFTKVFSGQSVRRSHHNNVMTTPGIFSSIYKKKLEMNQKKKLNHNLILVLRRRKQGCNDKIFLTSHNIVLDMKQTTRELGRRSILNN